MCSCTRLSDFKAEEMSFELHTIYYLISNPFWVHKIVFSIRSAIPREQPRGGRGQDPSTFLLIPILDSFLHSWVGSALLHCNKFDYFKIFLSTIHQIEQFEAQISKEIWERAHQAFSPDLSPHSFSGFALDSGFALKSRALRALGSGFTRFGPPTFEAWWRPCAIPYYVRTCRGIHWQEEGEYETINFKDYWNPKIYIENSMGNMEIQAESYILRLSNDVFIVERKLISGSFIECLDLTHFPFDVQVSSYICINNEEFPQISAQKFLCSLSNFENNWKHLCLERPTQQLLRTIEERTQCNSVTYLLMYILTFIHTYIYYICIMH